MSITVVLIATALGAAVAGMWLGHTAARSAAEARLQDLHQLLERARREALTDRLTGLVNRVGAEQLLAYRRHRGLPTVVALLDLDDFKTVNDTHGHRVGDLVLAVVARRLAAAAELSGGGAARLAGDEYLLILPHLHPDPARPVAAAQRAVAFHPVELDAVPDTAEPFLDVQASAGYTTLPDPHHHGVPGTETAEDATFSAVLHQADLALYHAKQHPGSLRGYRAGMAMPVPAGRRLRDQHRPGNGNGRPEGTR